MEDDEERDEDSDDEVADSSLEAGTDSLMMDEVEASVDKDEADLLVELSCVKENINRDELVVEVKVDATLKVCRDIADRSAGSYVWKNGLLV